MATPADADADAPMRSSLEPSLMRDSLSMPPAPKRRAFSVSDRGLYRGASSSASAARRAVSSALSNVSRFVRSNSADAPVIATDLDADAAHSPVDDPARPRARSYSATISAWKISSKLPQVPVSLKALRRPRALNLRRASTALVPWHDGHVQYVSAAYELHGEDAGAVSSYYHIVADGISAPFAGQAPEDVPEDRVSSAVIAKALVKAVERALEDVTNRNKEPLDAEAFELAVRDAIHATRVRCAAHRESRIATTLCVVYFDRWNSKLLSFTLGDSKCVVLRRGDLVFESTCTVREFNVPCVVNLSQPLEANDYLVETFDLAEGDVCLTFSDGVADNVYKDDILSAAEALENDSSSLQEICDSIVAQSSPEGASTATRPNDEDPQAHEPTGDDVPTPVATPEQPEDSETCPTDALRERLHSASMDDPVDTDTASSPPTPQADESMPETHQHKTPSKRFYPFATAAAYEYRRRVLRQKSVAPKEVLADKNFQRHVRDSALLLDLHDGKSVMDRQVLVSKANRRPHYTLVQLHRMAQIRSKKPDDVTLLISRFV